MMGRREGLVCACLLSALFVGGCSVMRAAMGGQHLVEDAEVSVGPAEMLVRFPAAAATSWACSGRGEGGRRYAWTVRLGRSEPGHVLNVHATVPDSVRDPGRAISRILDYAHPHVARVEGEPPVTAEVVDSTPMAFAVGDTALVVRVTDRAAIRRLARGRPTTARLMACADGNDAWSREVDVRYAPGF